MTCLRDSGVAILEAISHIFERVAWEPVTIASTLSVGAGLLSRVRLLPAHLSPAR